MASQDFIPAGYTVGIPMAAQSQQQGMQATREIMGQFCASTPLQEMWDSMQYYASKAQQNFQEE